MKTRLLLLSALLLSVFSFSQININEGFESGVAPTGWTSGGGITTTPVFSSYVCTGNYALIGNYMSNTNSSAVIYTSSYISNGASINASFKYRSDTSIIPANVYFYYEINNSGTWVLIASNNIISTTCTTLSHTFANGEISNGTSIRFRMQINSTSSFQPKFDDFSVVQEAPPTPQAIAEYSFDDTYNNVLGNDPFGTNTGTSFVTDRHGNTSGAININGSGTLALITGLSYGNAARSISVWAKTNVLHPTINYIFHYGNSDNGNGLAIRPNTTLYFANASANLETADTNINNTWIHYVCTYDGTTAKVYKNGILFSSGDMTFNTVNYSNIFKLGYSPNLSSVNFNGAIDDLKIYNYALNATEISNLYTNNTLSSSNFSQNNLEVSLYPNPANDILNIDTTLELKSIEIFNIQGQKVLESNHKQINVANLSSGIYMVKIQDFENNSITKKVIIK